MELNSQKMMAAKLMKCGKSRVWMDPSRSADISEAITSEDVRKLIKDGVIRPVPKKGLSSFRTKKNAAQKAKGRRRGRGQIKGAKGTRLNKKRSWIKTIRSIRILIKDLKAKKEVDNKIYRDLYMKSKSGYFRSKAHVMIYLERNNLIKKEQK
jgi:large subunit ribosomal protein L19e